MKNNAFIKISFLVLIGIVFTHLGCKKFTTDDISINVNTDVFNAPTIIIFENANDKTGSKNLPSNFKITITGEDKDKVTTSETSSNFTVNDGWISLQLAKGVSASQSDPIDFIVSAEIAGFEPVRKEVSIVSNGENKIIVKVIEVGNLPSGVIEKNVDFTLDAGKFSKAEKIVTPIGNGVNESITLDIEEGTVLKNAKGEVISGKNLKANVRYYDNSDQSVAVFPGGLSPRKVTDKNGREIKGGVNFHTAGLVDIDLNLEDKIVKNFSKPISAEMMLSPNLDNFETGQKVKVGDTIPVWSFDEITNVWKKEGRAEVFNSNNGLVARFLIDHLSAWNLDWSWPGFGANGTAQTSLDVLFDADWSFPSGNYEVTMRTPNGGYLGALHWTTIHNGFNARFDIVPTTPSVYIEIFDNNIGEIVAKTELFNPVTKGSVKIKMPSSKLEFIDVKMNYAIACSSNKKINPDKKTWVFIEDLETGEKYSYFTGSKGTLNLRLVNKKRYRISTRGIYGELISCESIFDVNNLKYDKIKGLDVKKLIYNPTTKQVEIDCLYTISKC